MDTAKTGAYLASLRKNAGMTQQDAADRLGVSNKTVSKWESGGGFPDITVLPALAELYGVTADDILAGAAVRSSGGDSQVAQYLARRGRAALAHRLLRRRPVPAGGHHVLCVRMVVAAAGRRRGVGVGRLGPV